MIIPGSAEGGNKKEKKKKRNSSTSNGEQIWVLAWQPKACWHLANTELNYLSAMTCTFAVTGTLSPLFPSSRGPPLPPLPCGGATDAGPLMKTITQPRGTEPTQPARGGRNRREISEREIATEACIIVFFKILCTLSWSLYIFFLFYLHKNNIRLTDSSDIYLNICVPSCDRNVKEKGLSNYKHKHITSVAL